MWKKIVMVIFLLCCGSGAFGQSSNQVCPISIKKVNPRALPFSSTLMGDSKDPWDSYLQIDYSNSSDKNIVGVRFEVYFLNGLNEAERSVFAYETEDRVAPGQTKKPYWGDGVYEHQYGRTMRALAWVEKVMFADGTSWMDDGSQSCGNVMFTQPNMSKPSGSQQEAATVQEAGSVTFITTEPSGADVKVDGKSGPQTPSRFMLLKKGNIERTIVISLKGYKTVEKKVVPDGTPIVLDIKLEKK